MKIAIVGSRDFPDIPAVLRYVSSLPAGTIVVSGGARGVDFEAVAHAKDIGLQTQVIQADWTLRGKSAGMIRNAEVVRVADAVVAFWDGISDGTADTIAKALKARKLRAVYPPGGAP